MPVHTVGDPGTILCWASDLKNAEGSEEEAQSFIPDPHDTVLSNLIYVTTSLQSYLTPFEILSLVEKKDDVGRDTLRYLAMLLEPPPPCAEPPGMADVECNVFRKLNDESQLSTHCWDQYRRHSWRSILRGNAFCEDLPVANIASSVGQARDNTLCDWWQYLRRVRTISKGENDDTMVENPSGEFPTS
ncbi:hypothetical protein BDV24DRAFT_170270 [Aspergillus arachidicola]|uniref:Uncharacterized protein n=1 Tax=Aspergillus arachidicola TaxID=656916 RepID=A0A5N6XPT2_9EURO|nr:hypothetical protein BDV24DRAFT_170270 [Aspergillus arachidicola]